MCQGAAMAKKSKRPVKGLSVRQFALLAGEGEVDDGGAEEEDEGDEAFGEDGEGEGGPHEVGVERVGRWLGGCCGE